MREKDRDNRVGEYDGILLIRSMTTTNGGRYRVPMKIDEGNVNEIQIISQQLREERIANRDGHQDVISSQGLSSIVLSISGVSISEKKFKRRRRFKDTSTIKKHDQLLYPSTSKV